MHDLLRQLTAERPDRAPARRLLTLVAPHENESEAAVAAGRAAAGQVAGGSGRQTQNQPLPEVWVEPLSRRELDVLRMLRSELDGPAIARHLGVSLATVRSHTQHIYTKLGVSNRRAAVRRAHQLNLFSTSAHP
jgi:LuxR family maltose regulon positive regulatory protein